MAGGKIILTIGDKWENDFDKWGYYFGRWENHFGRWENYFGRWGNTKKTEEKSYSQIHNTKS